MTVQLKTIPPTQYEQREHHPSRSRARNKALCAPLQTPDASIGAHSGLSSVGIDLQVPIVPPNVPLQHGLAMEQSPMSTRYANAVLGGFVQ